MITPLRPAGHRPHREGDRLVALAFSIGAAACSAFLPAGRSGPEGSDEGVDLAYGIRRLRSRRLRPAPFTFLVALLRAALILAGEKGRKL
ncbi:hypothetical protein EV128_11044 [Rhizobium azibense]|nr:hypothetical protein EV128_11044 [Rhizobium azibense]